MFTVSAYVDPNLTPRPAVARAMCNGCGRDITSTFHRAHDQRGVAFVHECEADGSMPRAARRAAFDALRNVRN